MADVPIIDITEPVTKWMNNIHFDGKYDEYVIRQELERRTFQGKPVKVHFWHSPMEARRNLMDMVGSEEKFHEAQFWRCFYDFFFMGFYEPVYDKLPPEKRTGWEFQFSLSDAFAAGLAFIIDLGDELVGIPMPALKWDERDRLHSPDGPAVNWADNEREYDWHGITIPQAWIESPQDLDVGKIWEDTANSEQRRCFCEIVGWERIVKARNGKVIDETEGGKLYQMDSDDDDGRPAKVLLMKNSTPNPDGSPKWYSDRVDPKSKTVQEAHASTWGFGRTILVGVKNPKRFYRWEKET